MEINITEIEPFKVAVCCEASLDEIELKKTEVLSYFKRAPVPGFRPGKASMEVIKVHYKNQINESLKRALTEDVYHTAIFEKKLKPHGTPQVKSILLTKDKFICDFETFIRPTFELSTYKGFDLSKPAEKSSSSELTEKMLQELRVRFGEVSPYSENDFVQNGDSVIVDYEGIIDNVKNDNLSAVGEMLTVGSSQLIEFDNNLLGMNLNETREFDVKVPENGLPSLAGKSVHFKVTLNMGSKTIPCGLDDALAKKLNKETFIELREYVKNMAEAQVTAAFKKDVNEAIINKLVQDNKFEVPNWLTLSEAQYLAQQAKLDWAKLEEVDKNKYMEMSEKNVRVALILDKIREDEPEAQLTDQEVFEVIKSNLSTSQVQMSIEDILKEMNKTGYLQILSARIKDEYVLDFIAKSVKIIE